MVVIYTTQNQIWPWKQHVGFHLYRMRCLIGNMCYSIVTNVQLFSYLENNQMDILQTNPPKYLFMSTETYHVVLYMVDIQKNNKNHV